MYFECNGCLTLDLPFPEPAAYAAPLFWLQPRREVVSNDYVTNTCISLLFWALWGFALFMGLTTSGCFRGFWAI